MAKLKQHSSGIGSIVEVLASLNEGAQARKRAYQTSQAYMDAANRRMAVATAEAQEEKRKKEYLESKAMAIAAMSGAGVDDPSIVNAIGDLNAEGEYRVLSKLYVGADEAEGMQLRAEQARIEGGAALDASYLKAIGIGGEAYMAGKFDSFFGSGKNAKKKKALGGVDSADFDWEEDFKG